MENESGRKFYQITWGPSLIGFMLLIFWLLVVVVQNFIYFLLLLLVLSTELTDNQAFLRSRLAHTSWMCYNLYFNLFRMQKMLLYTWEASGWEAVRSELTGQHGNHQPPKVHKKVRPSCNAVLCLLSCTPLFSGGIKHTVAKIMSLNHIPSLTSRS